MEEQWLEAVDPEVLRRRRGRIALVAGGLLLFGFLGVLAYWLKPPASFADDVPLAAEYAVAQHLQIHGKLHFNPVSDAQVTRESTGQYLVRGWVKDVASDGRTWSYLYSVTVIDGQSEYTFRDVTVMEQY